MAELCPRDDAAPRELVELALHELDANDSARLNLRALAAAVLRRLKRRPGLHVTSHDVLGARVHGANSERLLDAIGHGVEHALRNFEPHGEVERLELAEAIVRRAVSVYYTPTSGSAHLVLGYDPEGLAVGAHLGDDFTRDDVREVHRMDSTRTTFEVHEGAEVLDLPERVSDVLDDDRALAVDQRASLTEAAWASPAEDEDGRVTQLRRSFHTAEVPLARVSPGTLARPITLGWMEFGVAFDDSDRTATRRAPAARCRECGAATWIAKSDGGLPVRIARPSHSAACSRPPGRLDRLFEEGRGKAAAAGETDERALHRAGIDAVRSGRLRGASTRDFRAYLRRTDEKLASLEREFLVRGGVRPLATPRAVVEAKAAETELDPYFVMLKAAERVQDTAADLLGVVNCAWLFSHVEATSAELARQHRPTIDRRRMREWLRRALDLVERRHLADATDADDRARRHAEMRALRTLVGAEKKLRALLPVIRH